MLDRPAGVAERRVPGGSAIAFARGRPTALSTSTTVIPTFRPSPTRMVT